MNHRCEGFKRAHIKEIYARNTQYTIVPGETLYDKCYLYDALNCVVT